MLAYYLHNLDPFIFRIYGQRRAALVRMAYVLAFICGYLLFLWLAKRGYADLPPRTSRRLHHLAARSSA